LTRFLILLISRIGKLRSFAPWGNYINFITYIRPSCWDVDMLVKMLDSGMDVARLNFSHGDHKVIIPYKIAKQSKLTLNIDSRSNS
jgi:hypothetical protein